MNDKSEFHAGQVVMVKREKIPMKLRRQRGEPFAKDGNMYAVGGRDPWYHETELRPLKRSEWESR